MFKIISVVLVLFSSQLAAQKVYKWVDEKGQIHYSSKKPVDQEAETVKIKKGPKAPVKPVAGDGDKDEKKADAIAATEISEADSKARAAAAADLAKADKVNNKKRCDLAKQNAAALNATVRVTRTNAAGETVRMSDDERISALQRAQQAIKESCQ